MLNHVLRERLIVEMRKDGIKDFTFAIDAFNVAILNIKEIKLKMLKQNGMFIDLQSVQAQVAFIDKGYVELESGSIYHTLPQRVYDCYQASREQGEQIQLKEMLQLMYQLAFPNIKGVKNSKQVTFFNTRLNEVLITALNSEEELKKTKRKSSETPALPKIDETSPEKIPLLPRTKSGAVSPVLLLGDSQPTKQQQKKRTIAEFNIQQSPDNAKDLDDDWCGCTIL